MQDWLHKYPRVAALLQADDDPPLQTTAECLAEEWDALVWNWMTEVAAWRAGCRARYGEPRAVYVHVAPVLYQSLADRQIIRASEPGMPLELADMQVVPDDSYEGAMWGGYWIQE